MQNGRLETASTRDLTHLRGFQYFDFLLVCVRPWRSVGKADFACVAA